ncbi:MAG: RNA ligase family protein [Phenylobacterium sp.]
METLLTRDNFRKAVFERDNHKCVICGKGDSLDAHHIIERRLWPDYGMYISNGATLCPEHHILAEETTLSVEEIRIAAGIIKKLVPPHLYPDTQIDKWGNEILQNGQRLKGELFDDESVQKILAKKLHLFIDKVKYPRTFHLPWSPGVRKDDRVLDNDSQFLNKKVVCSIKMDGENCSMGRNYIHARSIDSPNHPSRNWVKNLHSQIAYEIPDGWRVCGENLYAKHSIFYDDLSTYFMAFSIWDDKNVCLSWDESLEWFEMLGVAVVSTFYVGEYDRELIQNKFEKEYDLKKTEGYVIRIYGSFHYRQFTKSIAKWVRKNHITENDHWFFGRAIERNKLK